MQDYLQEMAKQAHMGLHPAQLALTYGSTWVRFIDIAKRQIEFGRVITTTELVNQIDNNDQFNSVEKVDAREHINTSLANGYMFGFAASGFGQEWGITHKAHVWPIEHAVYEEALTLGCRVDELSLPAKINLEHAFRSFRSHVRAA